MESNIQTAKGLVTDNNRERVKALCAKIDKFCQDICANKTDKYAVSCKYKIDKKQEYEDIFVISSNAGFALKGTHDVMAILRASISQFAKEALTILPSCKIMLDLQFTESIAPNEAEKTSKETQKQKQGQEQDNAPSFVYTTPKYTFKQVILSNNIKDDILNALKVIECRDLIYHQWGFEEIEPAPKSILNFWGPPGTGKTMCAHAIASYLGKPLLALKYSEIESKYMGDAPKNLKRAFDTATETGAVLFFDEADSFLGKRIENVQQGSEQAINSLRSQMLIMLEDFSGVVIFATNLVKNYDKAFESRILKHIQFELPNVEARAAIIKKMLPKRLPVVLSFTDEQIHDVAVIADGLSGREIKGVILEMLLTKASKDTNAIFYIEDLKSAFEKKVESLKALRTEPKMDADSLKDKIKDKLKTE